MPTRVGPRARIAPARPGASCPLRDAAWDEDLFTNAHGIYIDDDDHLFCADNYDHTVRKLTTDGELSMTLGDPENPSETGFRVDHSPVCCSAGPFNMVTNTAVGPDGDLFVSDGYGNARVHRFSAEGELKASWGGTRERAGRVQPASFDRRRSLRPGLRRRSGELPPPNTSG